MNPTRAPSFRPQSRSVLSESQNWPQLPAAIELDRVVGVAVDSRGLIYVAHRGERPLLCLHPDGRLFREVGASILHRSVAYDLRGPVPLAMPERYWLHGLHVDPWDNVWVTDVSRHLVMKFDPNGSLLLTLGLDGEFGNDAQRFNQPTHVVVLPSREFFVTDGYGNARVIKFNARAERVLEWGTAGVAPGQFHTPHVITADAAGRLYVSDRENDRAQIFDQNGRLLSIWPDLHGVDGLYAAADGYIYGSAGVDHALLRFDQNGQVQDVWVKPDWFTYPHAVAVGLDGAIYLADTGDNWVLDVATAHQPHRTYALAPRSGGEGSRVVKVLVNRN